MWRARTGAGAGAGAGVLARVLCVHVHACARAEMLMRTCETKWDVLRGKQGLQQQHPHQSLETRQKRKKGTKGQI